MAGYDRREDSSMPGCVPVVAFFLGLFIGHCSTSDSYGRLNEPPVYKDFNNDGKPDIELKFKTRWETFKKIYIQKEDGTYERK